MNGVAASNHIKIRAVNIDIPPERDGMKCSRSKKSNYGVFDIEFISVWNVLGGFLLCCRRPDFQGSASVRTGIMLIARQDGAQSGETRIIARD